MLKYLIINLCDTSASFCHYENNCRTPKLISLENLKAGILFAMKENLSIQMIYPDYELPEEYNAVIETIDHIKIKPISQPCNADVLIIDSWNNLNSLSLCKEIAYVLRTNKCDFFENYTSLTPILKQTSRLNIVITDVETFAEQDFDTYKTVLSDITKIVSYCFQNNQSIQLNILTDRLLLDNMNNCNAGWESVTLAPDGRFYVCPAFYHEGNEGFSIGDLVNGLDIRNPQLYRLDHAPLCRKCDAYQCRRCVWLNRKSTLEVNTPSHEQCVVAHLERNASRDLLHNIRKYGEFLPDKDIKEIAYLDPFDVKTE